MTTNAKGAFQPDSDIHISFEDQQKINKFARLNARLEEAKEELKLKQTELKNLEEAFEEMELMDDSEQIPYLFGEMFLLQNLDTTKVALEEAKKDLEKEIAQLDDVSEQVKQNMSDLRTQLYAKFGNNINLEADED